MNEIKKKVLELTNGEITHEQGNLLWLKSKGKQIPFIDLNYALEMDRRGELENYLKELIK